MKKVTLSILATLLMVAQGLWAQAVRTEGDLKTAVKTDQATVTLDYNIELTNRLDIDGKTVTIDLNGHTLSRSLTAADADGQVIAVMNSGKLTIKDSDEYGNGKITGGNAYQGGGIYVYSGCELTIEGGIITGNCAYQIAEGGCGFGGGVENHGTMTMTGGTITGNFAGQYGGGIYNAEGATLTLTGGDIYYNSAIEGGGIYHVGSGGTLNMQGDPQVDDNTGEDVRLAPGQLITVTEAFTQYAHIGVAASVPGIFTTGYSDYNTAAPSKYFFVETTTMDGGIVTLIDGEASIGQTFDYVERAWDENAKTVTKTIKTCTNYTRINGSSETDWLALNDGWYVVTGNSSYESLVIEGADVHLIIPDDMKLTLTGGVRLMAGHKLTIYSQDDDEGVLNVTNSYDDAAGIGSATVEGVERKAGELVIHGGIISATGGKYGAGIGSGAKTKTDAQTEDEETNLCNKVTVYGGKVTAIGGTDGAGIGGGQGSASTYDAYGNHAGTFILYGGEVIAQGGSDAAGVGGGGGYSKGISSKPNGGRGGIVHVYGGTLRATGGNWGAGIGSGEQDNPIESVNAVTLYVYGGTVTAQGGNCAAGIGGGHNGIGGFVIVSGGEVTATGGKYGAGIGGGENSAGGNFRITGGKVTAKGAPGAAGIGGGDGTWGFGGQNYIQGGTVIAEAGTQGGEGNRAFGPGDNIDWGNEEYFSIEFGNEMTVYAGNNGSTGLTRFPSGERVEACKYRSYARVEPCTHEASTTYTIEVDQHSGSCQYCNLDGASHVLTNGKCTECGAVILNDDSDNDNIISSNAGSTTTPPAVFLKGRSFQHDGKWITLCLPFALSSFTGTPLEGATVKTLESASFNNNTLTLNFSTGSLTSIEAGKPYIVKWDSGMTTDDPKFTGVTLVEGINNIVADNTESDAASVVYFQGLFSPYAISGVNRSLLYLGGDNTIYYPNDKMTIGAFRAYFNLQGITASDKATDGVRQFVLNFGDEASGIAEVEADSSLLTPHSSLQEGWYTLDGRRLSGKPTQKGIYVSNGRKVVIN